MQVDANEGVTEMTKNQFNDLVRNKQNLLTVFTLKGIT